MSRSALTSYLSLLTFELDVERMDHQIQYLRPFGLMSSSEPDFDFGDAILTIDLLAILPKSLDQALFLYIFIHEV